MVADAWQDLTRSLDSLRATFLTSYEQHHGWSPDSPAHAECQSEPLAGAWSQTPSRDANRIAIALTMLVMDHLHGLGILFASETVTVTHTVARSALDIAIAPWFLLEPGIEARERIRRYMNLRLLRLKEQTMIAPGDSKDPAAEKFRQHAPQLVDRIVRTARKHGFTVKTPRGRYKPVHLTPDMPSTTTLAQEIVDPGGSSLGSMTWRINSAVAHGQLHGLGLFLVSQELPPGDRVASIEVQAKDAALLCLCAPLAALSLLRRMYHQFGWDMEPLTMATQDVLATWQRVARLQPEEVPATFRPEQQGLA